jgi:tRNA-2-methylthio-N6-dimethylallyladenosine synthase
MNRPYTKEQYFKLVNKISDKIPDIRITTDTIVGFPGETEDDFQKTVDIFKKIKFSQAYNNKYSPREGTAAFKLGDPIPWSEKERRWRILNDLVNRNKKI